MRLKNFFKSLRKLVPVLVIVPAVALVLITPRLIKIEDISCSSQFGVCGDYLQKEIVKAKGKNLIEAENYLNKLLTKEVKVLRHSIRFKLPNKIEIDVIERKPVYAVTKDGSNQFTLYDPDGRNVGKVASTQLPTITLKQDIESSKLIFAGNIMTDLYNVYSVKSGVIADNTLTIPYVEGRIVLFPLEGDRDILLGLLKLILSRLFSMSENSRIKTIDLRFKNPVLR